MLWSVVCSLCRWNWNWNWPKQHCGSTMLLETRCCSSVVVFCSGSAPHNTKNNISITIIWSSISPNKLIFTLFGACLRSPTQRHGVRTLFRNLGNLRRLRPSAVLRTIRSNEVRTLRTSSTVSHTVRHLWSESANAKKRGAFSSYVLASTGSTDYNQQPQTTTITTATIATEKDKD